MKNFILVILAALSAGFSFSAGADNQAGWRLVFADEFDHDGSPDPSKWTFDIGGGGWGNGESEYYTRRLENAHVENGRLILTARKENYRGSNYTSARMKTRTGGWTYGRFEIRAKLPHGAGTWPAIWMLALKQSYGTEFWPDNGEIDIMEYYGRNPVSVQGTYHMKNFNWMLGNQKTGFYDLTTAESEFHTYALEWGPNVLKTSVDGNVYNVYQNPHTNWGDWPFDKPFDIILNMALGGMAGGPIDDSIFPQTMQIEYVRVYQRAPAQILVRQ